ncbi:MAG: Asp-tRNA(Asn)/Glu-tRNA(Gln) amidotransferase subunit GatB [Dehalococcoidia bacterium]|nr:Asp-tRNA(Asn)/Glu-tRNA(Gln) amidotransferase subunit GatB [Dehalococcoidia bacterium]
MTSSPPVAKYEVVIGLECHAQVNTRSKMFCRCSTDYSGGEPNTHVCPVCMGMPGVLPVINAQAVEFTIMTGLALNCEIPDRAKFDRKNYPYPDLMKGYQISEYDMPLCQNGYIDVEVDGRTSRIRINRVHLEEDTARLLHRSDQSGDYSLLDVNRAGMPLMEIVTEPDARSPQEAVAYLTKLHQILRYLGVSDADMEKGNFRCEPNLSLRPHGSDEYGSKVELKNLNSFRAALRGMEFEVERQGRILDEGGHVVSETRGWREETQETASQRSKEQAHDYRYFPEPDLPPIAVSHEYVETLRSALPELPDARRERFMTYYGLSAYEAAVLTESRAKADYFEAALAASDGADSRQASAKPISNWLLGDLSRLLNNAGLEIEAAPVRPEQLAELVSLIESAKISGTAGKQVLDAMFASGREPAEIVAEQGLGRIEDNSVVEAAITSVIAANEKAVADYHAGKTEAVKFLVGQVMKETRGRANAAEVQALLLSQLDGIGSP